MESVIDNYSSEDEIKKDKQNIVFLKKCKNYEICDIKEIINKGLQEIGTDIMRKKVLIKPNLLSDMEAKSHAISQKEFIIALFDVLKKKNCKIFIGDSPALVKAYDVLKKLELIDDINRYNVQIVEFKGMDNKHIWKGINEFDVIINLCKLKTHSLMTYTGAVKNLYGFVPGKTKAFLHPIHPNPVSFGRLIYDIYNTIKPKINIIDAIVSMQGNGPANGSLRKTGFIGISDDALALDLVILDLIKFKNTPLHKVARNNSSSLIDKKGNLDFSQIILRGEKIPRVNNFKKPIKGSSVISIFFPQKIRKLISFFISRKPIPTFKCVACKKCVEMCPVKAIKIEELAFNRTTKKIAMIDYSKCIKCYCCHEICPYGAIKISFFKKR